jgi:hypothetical protein
MSDSPQPTPRRGAAAPPPDEEKLPAAPNGGVPAVADQTDFAQEAGAGFEGTRLEEQTVPFLRMAQGLSPELNPGKGEYIPGLALGQIFNTATRERYAGQPGVPFIACRKEYGYGQWIPRDLGSGFRGMVSPDNPLVRETMSRMTAKYGSSARFKFPRYKNGVWSDDPPKTRDTQEAIELVETGQLYLLYGEPPVLTYENARRAVVAFTSTALGSYTGYNDKHLAQRWPQRSGPPAIAPIYAYMWNLSTFLDKRGTNEFYNWRVDLAKQGDYLGSLYAGANPELFGLAKEFFAQIAAGVVRADDTAGQADPTAGPARQPGEDDDVPF